MFKISTSKAICGQENTNLVNYFIIKRKLTNSEHQMGSEPELNACYVLFKYLGYKVGMYIFV